jgi:hypothetical protein
LIESCQHRRCFINEGHLFISPPSSQRVARDGNDCNGEEDVNSKDSSTSIGDASLGDNENDNINDDEVAERGELSLLKPDEEFLGLFSTPASDSE